MSHHSEEQFRHADAVGCRGLVTGLLILIVGVCSAVAQDTKPPKKRPPFRWVNPPAAKLPRVKHDIFKSPSMEIDVGYRVQLPRRHVDVDRQPRDLEDGGLGGGHLGHVGQSVFLVKIHGILDPRKGSEGDELDEGYDST